jgi:hypothetical protein
MWTSANGMRALQKAIDLELGHAAGGAIGASGGAQSFEGARLVRSFEASFVGMVMPGDEIVTQVTHVGMHAATGRRVLLVESSAVRRGGAGSPFAAGAVEPVLRATAHAEQVPTAYVFTGQGSAAAGMGMALYESSPVARAVWDEADRHLFDTYGFSILHVVRANPKALTVHFGGQRGADIRRNFMALETEAPDGSGPQPLLPSISEETDSYTFRHPDGRSSRRSSRSPRSCSLRRPPSTTCSRTASCRSARSSQGTRSASTRRWPPPCRFCPSTSSSA